MLRAFVRLSAVTAIALALVVVAVPTADARPVATRAVPSVDQSWFALAWAWLSSVVPAVSHPANNVVHKDSTQLPSDSGFTTRGGAQPMT
ncbi:MAG TPA: hypothetical protein VGE98_04735, partial [Thermoanaerobaculia bacterium]